MHYREIAFVAGLAAIMSLSQPPASAQAKPKSSTNNSWTLPELPTANRIFREFGPTTLPRHWSGQRNWAGVRF